MPLIIAAAIFGAAYLLDARQKEIRRREHHTQIERRLEALRLC
jgi:hypothetical protein